MYDSESIRLRRDSCRRRRHNVSQQSQKRTRLGAMVKEIKDHTRQTLGSGAEILNAKGTPCNARSMVHEAQTKGWDWRSLQMEIQIMHRWKFPRERRELLGNVFTGSGVGDNSKLIDAGDLEWMDHQTNQFCTGVSNVRCTWRSQKNVMLMDLSSTRETFYFSGTK